MDARVVTICRNEKNHTRLRVWLDSLVEAATIELSQRTALLVACMVMAFQVTQKVTQFFQFAPCLDTISICFNL